MRMRAESGEKNRVSVSKSIEGKRGLDNPVSSIQAEGTC